MSEPIAIVSMSGGKDSTATALLAIERYGRERVRCVFADTGHEHPATLDYVNNYLPGALCVSVQTVRADFSRQMAGKRQWIRTHWEYAGVPLERIDRALELLHPTGNPYLDLCMWKGRFPSRKAQFCTEELKGKPLDAFIDAMPDYTICESWRGIRRDESQNRAEAKDEYVDATKAGRVYRVVHPIAAWTAAQVVEYVLSCGVKLNPLYSQGMKRVGCMPCINCGKDELLEISQRWPEEIARVAEWERLVAEASKHGAATFFADADGDGPARAAGEYSRIGKVVEWAKTSRGGKQYDLLRAIPSDGCSSLYGLCE
jgi:3'-phosphoadenosine 5'-phosphosulfate sulfotransferase (PAPS reductase)/FAD synthetase